MGLLDWFRGNDAILSQLEAQLIRQEDFVFKIQDGEEESIRVHVRADVPRFETLNLRQRVGEKRSVHKSDRNLTITIGLFALVLAKMYGLVDLVWKLLMAL
jgi:hypothetical protein